MNLVELKKSIDSGELRNLYILTGEEFTILNAYIEKIVNASGAKCVKSDSVYQIYRNLDSRSLLSNGKTVYVVREDKEFLTAESLWKDIESKLKARQAVLILKYDSIDSRSKFAKHFDDYITVFERLSDVVLKKYVFKEVNLSPENVDDLIEICGSNYGRILLEIDKIKHVMHSYNLSANDSYKLCISANAIYKEPAGQLADLVDSILTRNYRTVYKRLDEARLRGDNELYLLSILHNNIKTLLQIQTFGNSDNKKLIQATGLSQYQINSCTKYINRYSCEELVTFMKYIKYCDESIKNGLFAADFAVDYLIVNVI